MSCVLSAFFPFPLYREGGCRWKVESWWLRIHVCAIWQTARHFGLHLRVPDSVDLVYMKFLGPIRGEGLSIHEDVHERLEGEHVPEEEVYWEKRDENVNEWKGEVLFSWGGASRLDLDIMADIHAGGRAWHDARPGTRFQIFSLILYEEDRSLEQVDSLIGDRDMGGVGRSVGATRL
ncbi:hypothetical protein BDV97DRAFT_175882 [Delphinella strobiligena]|nr:hypothetical protein BDV97DRAFT_175882 [Delphinella strobiligena]